MQFKSEESLKIQKMDKECLKWHKPSKLCSLQEQELQYSEIPWKPVKGDEAEELLKIVRRILNKITVQNFSPLCTQFLKIPIDSEKKLSDVIDLIIYKAVNEPVNIKVYANLCKVSSKMEILKEVDGKEEKIVFRKLLVNKLQHQFEENEKHVLKKDHKDIEAETMSEDKIKLDFAQYREERILRTGLVRFIGELYKLRILAQNIIFWCVEALLKKCEDITMECLAVLLTTIGKSIVFGPVYNANDLRKIALIFEEISKVVQKKKGPKVSPRVRFMLQDVIDLRKNKWIPRREDSNLKTMDNIIKELKTDSLEMSMFLKYSHLMNWSNNLQEDKKETGVSDKKPDEDDGWTSVGSKNNRKTAPSVSTKTKKEVEVPNNMDKKSNSVSDSQDDITKKSGKKKKNKPKTASQNVSSAATKEIEDRIFTVEPTDYKKMLKSSFDPSKIQIKPQYSVPKDIQHNEPPPSSKIPMDQVQSKLFQLMKEKKPYSKVLNFILESVGDRLEDPQFSIALVTATCEACISGTNIDKVNFKRYERLIKQFLKNKDGREVLSLDAIHNLILRLKHPQGLVLNIFNLFLMNDLITKHSFLKWRDDDTKLEQKAVSLTQLSSFFAALEKSQSNKKTAACIKQESQVQVIHPASPLSMDQVHEELLKLMREKKQFAQILNFILNTVGDKVEDLNFTCALVTAFCEACISDSNSFDQVNFKRYEKLIKRFVKDKEPLEIECLRCVHNLVLRLNHPEGLLSNLFNMLLDENLISRESFLKWKNDEDLEDKTIALTALTSFFSSITLEKDK